MVGSTVNGILPNVFSYISHFVCLYNFNCTGRPLRDPGIIGIFVRCDLHSKNCFLQRQCRPRTVANLYSFERSRYFFLRRKQNSPITSRPTCALQRM